LILYKISPFGRVLFSHDLVQYIHFVNYRFK